MNIFNRQMVILVVLTSALCHVASAQEKAGSRIMIPKGKHVLVDGKISPGEWDDARRIETSNSVLLYVKRDERFLYLGVQAEEGVFSVNLYFDRGGETPLLNLHASAKLGEREGFFGKWPDWVWWNNDGWAANVVRVASFEPRAYLPGEAKEYQIKIERIGAWQFWLSADVSNGDKVRSIPDECAVRYGRCWLELLLHGRPVDGSGL